MCAIKESLANAKVSARQQYVHEGHLAMKSTTNQRREHVGRPTTVAIFIHLAVVASQVCEIPRNSTKIRT